MVALGSLLRFVVRPRGAAGLLRGARGGGEAVQDAAVPGGGGGGDGVRGGRHREGG